MAGIELEDLGDGAAELEVFAGASSGLISDADLGEAANALAPGTAAALLVFENTWAAPFAAAVRRSGGQLVASGHPRRRPPRRPRRGRGSLERNDPHARTTSRRRPHRDHRRHRDQRQQPRLPPPEHALGRTGSGAAADGPGAAAAGERSVIDQLKELGELKAQGIRTEEEFAAQKAKLLGA